MGVSTVVTLRFLLRFSSVFLYNSVRWFSATCKASWAFSIGVFADSVWREELAVLLLGVAELTLGGENGVPTIGTAVGGGVSVKTLLGVNAVALVLLLFPVGFVTLLVLVCALGAMFHIDEPSVKIFTSGCSCWVVALRQGFLGWACAGTPKRPYPAFADWRVGWFWRWVDWWSFSGSLVGPRKFFFEKSCL